MVDRADDETASPVDSLPARSVVLAVVTKFVAMTGKVATKCLCKIPGPYAGVGEDLSQGPTA